MNKLIMIYRRTRDGIYVIPHGVTTKGALYQTEPFEYLPLDADEKQIWRAVMIALQSANKPIPHPQSWDQETAWYKKAGVRTWGKFAKGASVASVEEIGGEYSFRRLVREGGAFRGSPDGDERVPISAPMAELCGALKRCMELES